VNTDELREYAVHIMFEDDKGVIFLLVGYRSRSIVHSSSIVKDKPRAFGGVHVNRLVRRIRRQAREVMAKKR
jgi:hypothetical protein